jgi:integrase
VVAPTLTFYRRVRACEIKALRWQDIELANRLLHVRRSKTPAGWGSPTLNATCLSVLQELHDTSAKLVFTQPTPFVLPICISGRNVYQRPRSLLPSRPFLLKRSSRRQRT